MKIVQSRLAALAAFLVLSIPASASFPCQEFYSRQPELTLDELLVEAEFVGMYMAKSAKRTEQLIDGGFDYFYEYEMIQMSQLKGRPKLSFKAIGLPPFEQIPQHYLAMLEHHSLISVDNVTEYGLSQPARNNSGGDCFFAPRMVVGYTYLVIGGVDSQVSYEMIPNKAVDDWYKMVRNALMDGPDW